MLQELRLQGESPATSCAATQCMFYYCCDSMQQLIRSAAEHDMIAAVTEMYNTVQQLAISVQGRCWGSSCAEPTGGAPAGPLNTGTAYIRTFLLQAYCYSLRKLRCQACKCFDTAAEVQQDATYSQADSARVHRSNKLSVCCCLARQCHKPAHTCLHRPCSTSFMISGSVTSPLRADMLTVFEGRLLCCCGVGWNTRNIGHAAVIRPGKWLTCLIGVCNSLSEKRLLPRIALPIWRCPSKRASCPRNVTYRAGEQQHHVSLGCICKKRSDTLHCSSCASLSLRIDTSRQTLEAQQSINLSSASPIEALTAQILSNKFNDALVLP
jgi:hypothetical protein